MICRSFITNPDRGASRVLVVCSTFFVVVACGRAHAFCEEGGLRRDALRLQAHEPSCLTLRNSEGDDNALQVHYSLRYMLDPDFEDEDAIYLKYNGGFDFYMGTRASSPVVNRLSNIGLHYRCRLGRGIPLGEWNLGWLDVGIEHRSNGQTTEVLSPRDAEAARRAYASNNHRYFDSISRGSDYFSLETKASRNAGTGSVTAYAKLKLYINQHSEVTWGPLARRGVSVADYDRLTLTARYGFDRSKYQEGATEASLTWTLGDKGFATDSVSVDFMHARQVGPLVIPFYVRYHVGPMNTLSDYTRSQKSIGFGVKFHPGW